MPNKGFTTGLENAIEEAAMLMEEARAIAYVMTIAHQQFQSHPNYDIIMSSCDRQRAKVYSRGVQLVQALMNGAYVTHRDED
jgi:hypothetical protein